MRVEVGRLASQKADFAELSTTTLLLLPSPPWRRGRALGSLGTESRVVEAPRGAL